MDKYALTILVVLWLIWLAYKGALFEFVKLGVDKVPIPKRKPTQ